VLDWKLWQLDRGVFWCYLRRHVVREIYVVGEVGIELQRGLRLVIYSAKGREVWVWRSNLASRSAGDSNARSLWSWNQMTTTLLWQRTVRKMLPRIVGVTVGAKIWKDREWRALDLRQIRAIVEICRELAEVVVVISTLA
jgi:hypothetical protein